VAQFGRPSADTLVDNWTEDDGTSVTIYDQIDEVTVDDTDYIDTGPGPTNDVYVTKLSTLTDPETSTEHVVRYRYAKSEAGGLALDLTVQLRQAYVNEGSPGILIAAWTHAGISEVFTTQAQALSGAEADSITDYADLYLRFIGNQT